MCTEKIITVKVFKKNALKGLDILQLFLLPVILGDQIPNEITNFMMKLNRFFVRLQFFLSVMCLTTCDDQESISEGQGIYSPRPLPYQLPAL